MDLDTLRQIRRALSAAVALAGIALLVIEMRAPGSNAEPLPGALASLALVLTLGGLVVVWRKELAANEAAFAERERAQLALLKLQVELAKQKQQGTPRAVPRRAQPGDADS